MAEPRFRVVGLSVVTVVTVAIAATLHAASIDHRPVGCVVADRFPRLEAMLEPADTVARARIFFRADAGPWYTVALAREGSVFAGTLPKPTKSLKQFSYYLEAALGYRRRVHVHAVAAVSDAVHQQRLSVGSPAREDSLAGDGTLRRLRGRPKGGGGDGGRSRGHLHQDGRGAHARSHHAGVAPAGAAHDRGRV
ncbi:MAG TPA: hypothetical protein VMR21_16475, partial [Vicinamibacteria bacterium]|nr:hypothetical protein [Vicinamibacteria bacterium]